MLSELNLYLQGSSESNFLKYITVQNKFQAFMKTYFCGIVAIAVHLSLLRSNIDSNFGAEIKKSSQSRIRYLTHFWTNYQLICRKKLAKISEDTTEKYLQSQSINEMLALGCWEVSLPVS